MHTYGFVTTVPWYSGVYILDVSIKNSEGKRKHFWKLFTDRRLEPWSSILKFQTNSNPREVV